MIKTIKILAISLIAIAFAVFALVYFLTFHPATVQTAEVHCPSSAPVYNPAKPLKAVSYNVQYMAGKDYVFFYDLLDNSGPDTRPSPSALKETLSGVAQLIRDIDADVLLLQELHEDHVSSDYQDQTQLLLEELGNLYPCYTEAFYWKADFVPMAEIMGSVGMKLVTLSKYKIENGVRHQLSKIPSDPITQAFNLKRAILSVDLPATSGEPWAVMNTHLDAFSQGTDTMERQVEEVDQLIESVATRPWLIGGDYNLLADGQYERLREPQRAYYNPNTELERLHAKYPSVPSLEAIQGSNPELWFTHFPNDPRVAGPDRTIDYIFHSPSLDPVQAEVVQGAAISLSDHLPVAVTLSASTNGN